MNPAQAMNQPNLMGIINRMNIFEVKIKIFFCL
jgi:hypothetical protein